MCRHMYDWNIVSCDVKQPIQLNSTQKSNFTFKIELKVITVTVISSGVVYIDKQKWISIFFEINLKLTLNYYIYVQKKYIIDERWLMDRLQ